MIHPAATATDERAVVREQSPARDAAAGAASVTSGATLRALLADRWLAAILLLALAMRVLVWWLAPHADWLGDEREYYSAAAILADGRGFAFIDQSTWVRPPLYIALLGILFRAFGPGATPVWVVQSALGLATIALVYLLSMRYYRWRAAARLAALLGALYLPFAVYARLLLSETLFTFLIVLAFVALTLHAREGGRVALVVAGGALGAAILTRGIALPFLAAVPLWALALHGVGQPLDWRATIGRSAVVIGVALLVIAPWTARNAVAYGRLIPVDTTGGYNFWLGALDGRDEAQVDATLRAIPNQGDRQGVAWARGWAVVRADLPGYAGKSLQEAVDLWRINFAAYERLIRGYTLGHIPAPWLGLTIVLDDLLYLLALPLAIVGFVATERRPDRRLLLLWVGWNCLTGALFFAITRFRLPLMPFILILAARGVLELPAPRDWPLYRDLRVPRRWFVPAALAMLVVALILPTVDLGQYALGIRRAADDAQLTRGYALLRDGRADAARATFEGLPADFYARPAALAAVLHLAGRDDEALALLDDERDPIGATLLRGDIFRAQGRVAEATEALNYRDVRIANPIEQAWDRLSPPPLARLDVGDGLDLGYARGCQLDERDPDGTTYRWTTGSAAFRLAAPAGATQVRLRLRSYRPAGPPSAIRITAGAQPAVTVTPTTAWAVYEVPLAAGTGQPGGAPLVVRIDTATFVPGYADQRQLGAMIDWIELR